MKVFSVRFGLARSLVALAVSFALGISTPILAFASLSKSGKSEATRSVLTEKSSAGTNAFRADSSPNEIQVTARATATATGVMLHWSTNSTPDNLGFNVYRLHAGQRIKVNKEIIPGALFASGTPALMHAGYSYSWFDRGGTAESTYFIESVSVQGSSKVHEAVNVSKAAVPGFEQTPELSGNASTTEGSDKFEKSYPAAESQLRHTPNGTIQEQWAIAAQTGLKIGVKKDGWYRVTQEQMVAAGFNPTVDIRNLRLFVDADEVAIATNQALGTFGGGDYIEFYGRGLDTPVTDTRIYYLLAGTTPGKRVSGDIELDSPPVDPPGPTGTPRPVITPPVTLPPGTTPTTITPKSTGQVLRDPIFYSWVLRDFSVWTDSLSSSSAPVNREPGENDNSRPSFPAPAVVQPDNYQQTPEQMAAADGSRQEQAAGANNTITENANPSTNAAPVVASTTAAKVETPPAPSARAATVRKFQKQRASKKKKRSKLRRKLRQEHNHVFMGDGFAPTNFDHTIQIKNRGVYLANLQNGDEENWFGNVIASTPVDLTLTATNADLSGSGPATLEFAIQGVSSQFANPHAITVSFNGAIIDTLNFGASERPVRTIQIPLAQLQSGNNTLRFTKTSTGEVSIVDYVRLTYPHLYKADSVDPCATPNRVPESLKFNLLGSQSLRMDGFCTPLVRLIDYTDPLNVSLMKPDSEPSAFGYSITVPKSETFSKEQRLLYAIQQGQFAQPASLVLSQPSSLNLSSNRADFLIISHKTFIPSFSANVTPINTSLVAQRTSQNFSVSVVDIEDVYDEFSFGLHGPQAIRAFLLYASTNWATVPRYVIFAGDSSLDPRNYTGLGNFDFVPTKLVDATFNETCSDDWLTDFDDDGIANIPVGRLPFRTMADASLIISKIVNFTPVAPQSAMLVADDPTGYYFNFETANDQVQALLPGSMIVQRVNVRTDGIPAAKANVIAGFNQGRALVNYTGHGNVDVWTGSSIFNANDALALSNGSNLSFVVVMDCLNGYFLDPTLLSMSEALLKAPNGGAVAAFASSGLTFPDGQHEMAEALYTLLYGPQPIALGDAIKSAKGATLDADVRRTWVFFGDPSMKIR